MASPLLIYSISALLLAVSTPGAVSYRKELKPEDGNNQKLIRQLGHPQQFSRVNPSQVIQLSRRPRVFLYRGFLSDDECDHLISLAQGGVEKLLRKDLESGKPAGSITSLYIGQDDIVRMVEDRISGWTFLPKGNSQGMQILHYGPENSKQHLDYYGNKSKLEYGEPIMATVILYLSNVTQGGETLFLEAEDKHTQSKDGTHSDCAKAGFAVKPIRGNALLFFNLQPNTAPDASSSNARCPVVKGEKWCATKFFHLRPLRDKTVPFESDDKECTDEDDNCPQWAAMGECQKNPVYMVGTPDYYGTCRKSCKVC